MGSLPFSVGPLVNSAGEDWMLSTSASSHVVMDTHCSSGPRQCVSLCCLAHRCIAFLLRSSASLPQTTLFIRCGRR